MAGSRPGPARAPRANVLFALERTPVMLLARSGDNRAWEQGVYGAIYRANLRIAREGQRRAVANLETSLVRPLQRTGRLEAAVANPQAVYADGSRIVLGVGDFLDRVARYWRQIEFGSGGESGLEPRSRLLGQVFRGMFTPAGKGGTGPLEAPKAGVTTGRPIIFDTSAFTFTIDKPIAAHWYFRRAWESLDAGYAEGVYAEELGRVTGPSGRPLKLASAFRARAERPFTGTDTGFRV